MLAIDRDAIVEEVYADLADPLATVVPAGVAGHDPDRCPTCAPDPERAADIIAFAFPDGDVPTVHIDYDESPARRRWPRWWPTTSRTSASPPSSGPLPLDEYKAFVVSGDQELFSFGWIGAYGSPDAYLAPLFGSSANDNLTGYRSDQVDGLLERARASTDAAENAERWAAAERWSSRPRWSCRSPSSAPRSSSPTASRASEHAVDGTVDWSQVSLTG